MSNEASKQGRVVAAVKEAAMAALLAAVLASFILGVRTVSVDQGLTYVYRPWLIAIAVGGVFFGRLFLRLVWWKDERTTPVFMSGLTSSLARAGDGVGKYLAPAIVVAAFLLPFFASRYIVDTGTLILTYVLLGWGLNVVVGLAGLLDLGYVAFYAVGAYAYALLATHFGLSFWVVLPLAGLMAAAWGVILGFPVLRLRGDYLAIVTLAFGEIIRIILLNWYSVTKGPDGISGIPRPSFFGMEFKRIGDNTFADFFGLTYSPMHRIIYLYYIILVLALITSYVTRRLRALPVGRAWEAMREDEIACRALGINTTNTKLTAFAIGAFFGGLGGSFFATRQGFISPESFTFIESAIILAIVVLGGMGSQIGVVIAAIVMIGGFEVFREAAQYRMLIFGLLMVVIMVWRPRGLVAERMPTIFLGKRRKAVRGEAVAEGEA